MYESFYNLSARPFQLMPDPRLLFESRDHKRALSYLLYGLERHEGLVVITGDVGMGKTLLVQTLLNQLRNRNLSIGRVAMANLDAESVLPSVAAAFGLPHKSRSKIELLDDLVKRLLPSQQRGALLIVDEAQTCTLEALEELRAVSNLQANGRALLQVFLVGQTDLRDRLAVPAMAHLRQRIVAYHHLQPLDAEEVRAYIQHRLRFVGWRDEPNFSDDVYTMVHEWSRGIPRRINLIMDRFLLYGYLEQLKTLSGEDLTVVIDEFEEEFADDTLAFGNTPSTHKNESMSAADIDHLNERMVAIEQGLGSALGRKRAAELLDKHQSESENKEIIAAQMRISRLENLIADLLATGETSRPRRSTVTPIALAPKEPDDSQVETETPRVVSPDIPVAPPEPDKEPVAISDEMDADETETSADTSSVMDAIDEITPGNRRHEEIETDEEWERIAPGDRWDADEDSDRSARWRLFSRKEKR